MDHLPNPIDGEHPRVQLYAPATEVFHPEDFFKLPEKFGYDNIINLVEYGLDDSMDSRSTNEFIQCWLYFALLAQVLNRSIDVRDFLYDEGQARIHTKDLSYMIQEWLRGEQEEADFVKSQGVRFQWVECEIQGSLHELSHAQKTRRFRASMALESASRFISKHCSHKRFVEDSLPVAGALPFTPNEKPIDPRLDDLLILSIVILGETLQQARPKMMPYDLGRFRFFRDDQNRDSAWGYNTFCRRKMKESGFCPLEIRRMESSTPSVTIIYYACFINKKNRPTHSDACTVSTCIGQGNRIAPLHMKTACQQEQTNSGCRASQIPDRETRLKIIIDEGKMPLVTFRAGKLELDGYPVKTNYPQFGVMSHSWEEAIVHCTEDDIGRDDRHMHVCQLETLQNTFNKLLQDKSGNEAPKDVPFYVDVLCMPKQPSTRAAAINQLKHLYHKASAVLVWDRNMLQRPKTDDIFEVSMRVRTGDWITRLWTFQEIVLARDGAIHIAFDKEETISVSDIQVRRDRVGKDLSDKHHYVHWAGHPFSRAISNLRTKADYRVQRAWEAVQHRQILNHVDETIVLASVLGVDVTAIQEIGQAPNDRHDIANRRMAKLLHILDTTEGLGIPSGIIFLPGRKLPIEGFEWAPSTWLTKHLHPYQMFRPVKQAATLLKDGALVQFPGIVLHCPTVPIVKPEFWFPVHESMHKIFKVRADVQTGDWARFYEEEVNTPKGSEVAIIMCTGDTRDKWEVGVLVKSKGFLRLGEIRRVEILCRIWIRIETTPKVISDCTSNMLANCDQVIFGRRLESSQEWCVGGRSATTPNSLRP